MFVEKGQYYLYRHIRLDTNMPFYIGISKKPEEKSNNKEYYRAFDKWKRNDIWKRIYKKVEKRIEIQILFETNDHDFLVQKEKEFIKLYGRLNNNTGILANITDGGQPVKGHLPTEEDLQKAKLGSLYRYKKIIQLDLEGNYIQTFESTVEAGRIMKCSDSFISHICRNSGNPIFKYQCKGFLYIYENDYNPNLKYSFKKDISSKVNLIKAISKPILQYDLEGNFIREWENSIEATKSLSKIGSRISTCILRGYKYALGYQWFKKLDDKYLLKIDPYIKKHKKLTWNNKK